MVLRIYKLFSNYRHLSLVRTNKFVSRNIAILGIETSCDDTGAAIVDDNGIILGESINTQQLVHLKYGGIMPPIARDLHKENIENVVKTALNNAKLDIRDIDAIAVTVKPGLPLSLLVGMNYGKHLSKLYNKPFIPIHHMEAHALTVRLIQQVEFPFLVLLISGGHCLLSLVRDVNHFLLLGESLDDAPGEAFDKVARRLKLTNLPDYRTMSGGQAIELASRKGDPAKFSYTSSLSKYRDCNFSFSGLKSRAKYHIIASEKANNIEADGIIPEVYDVCASFQLNVTRHLCRRVQRAVYFVERQELLPEDKKTLVVSGGVACNSYIKYMLQHVCNELGYQLVVPPPRLCTDNGVMIAWNGVELWKSQVGIVAPDRLDTVDIDSKCKLGVSMIEAVREADITCTWIKLPVQQYHKSLCEKH